MQCLLHLTPQSVSRSLTFPWQNLHLPNPRVSIWNHYCSGVLWLNSTFSVPSPLTVPHPQDHIPRTATQSHQSEADMHSRQGLHTPLSHTPWGVSSRRLQIRQASRWQDHPTVHILCINQIWPTGKPSRIFFALVKPQSGWTPPSSAISLL